MVVILLFARLVPGPVRNLPIGKTRGCPMIADLAKAEFVSRRGQGGSKRKLRGVNAVFDDTIGDFRAIEKKKSHK